MGHENVFTAFFGCEMGASRGGDAPSLESHVEYCLTHACPSAT